MSPVHDDDGGHAITIPCDRNDRVAAVIALVAGVFVFVVGLHLVSQSDSGSTDILFYFSQMALLFVSAKGGISGGDS